MSEDVTNPEDATVVADEAIEEELDDLLDLDEVEEEEIEEEEDEDDAEQSLVFFSSLSAQALGEFSLCNNEGINLIGVK